MKYVVQNRSGGQIPFQGRTPEGTMGPGHNLFPGEETTIEDWEFQSSSVQRLFQRRALVVVRKIKDEPVVPPAPVMPPPTAKSTKKTEA